MDNNIDEILDFWFGDMNAGDGAIAERQASLWWGQDREHDREIAERFGGLVPKAVNGDLDDWTGSPRGRLALILLLDQFPRVLYRDRPEAFAHDALALAQSLHAQSRGEDVTLRPVERIFVYLPMQHAESLMVQDESVRRYEALLDAVDEADRPAFENVLDFARRHREVILRFDRFPHRNAILGRTSTPAEKAILENPDFRF